MLEKQCFIPEPEEFSAELPMTATLKELKAKRDEEIRDVIAGRSEKMLVVIGPCSVKHPTGVAGQEPPFQSRFLASPSPWLVRASFLPELSRSES